MGILRVLGSFLAPAALAAVVLLGGCRTPAAPRRPPPADEFVSLAAVAAELGLERLADGEHGRIVFAGPDGDEIKALPGSRALSVHGRPLDTSEALRLRGDELWLHPEDAAELQRIWIEEEAAGVGADPAPTPDPLPPPPPKPKKPEPRAPPVRPVVVVLDAGHGGRDPGALAAAGAREKDIVLDVTLRAARLLRAEGVEVTLTRSHDTFVELDERAAIGNRARARLFVSLHADAAANVSAHGYGVFVRRGAPSSSRRAADALLRALRTTGGRNRGVKEANFRVLRLARGPAVLVELGFLSNPLEAQKLSDPKHRRRLAECVTRGVLQFLGR